MNWFNYAAHSIDLRSDDVCLKGIVSNRSPGDHHAASYHPRPVPRTGVLTNHHALRHVPKLPSGGEGLRLGVLQLQEQIARHVSLQVCEGRPHGLRVPAQCEVIRRGSSAAAVFRQSLVRALEVGERGAVEASPSFPAALRCSLHTTVVKWHKFATRKVVDAGARPKVRLCKTVQVTQRLRAREDFHYLCALDLVDGVAEVGRGGAVLAQTRQT